MIHQSSQAGKAHISDARSQVGNTRETNSSPKCMSKSQYLELKTTPSTLLMKRKSESLENYNRTSYLRRSESSDFGRESLCPSSSSSKQCELNLSELKMNTERAEVHMESVVMKRKKMTGHNYKARFKFMRKHGKEIVPEKLCLSQSEKLLNYQGTEEQIHSVDSKKRDLKRTHTDFSLTTTESGRDHLLAGEDIDQETSNVGEGRSPFLLFKLENVKMNIEKDSAKEEHYEGQVLSQQELAVKDKDAGSEIDNLISQIQKKCSRRMNKLIQKQQEKIQEFHRIWEEKRSKLEKDYKLEYAMILVIYEGPARTNKLKLLDGEFAKKMEENNLQKDMQLKDIEAEQLAARDEEGRKEARWLAESKSCSSSELKAVYGPTSLGSQSEEVAGCSQSSAHILGTKDMVPLTRQDMEDDNQNKSVQGNDVALSDKSVSASAEEMGCNVLIGNSSSFVSTDPQNEVGVAFSERSTLAAVEQLNQQKKIETMEIICVKLPASRESDFGEMRPNELNKEVLLEVPETVPNETVDCANPVELSNSTSNEGFDERDAIGMPNALVNQKDGTDETTTGGLPLAGQPLEPSEQTKASPHSCTLLLPQVPKDQIHGGLVSAVIQDQGAQVVEKQNTSPFEVAASELVDTITVSRSNVELQDRDAPAMENQSTSQIEVATLEIIDTGTPEDSSAKLQDRNVLVVEDQVNLTTEVANSELIDTANPVQSIIDALPTDNREKLHLESIDVSPSCSQSPSIEVVSRNHNLERNSCQTVEIAETEVLSHESSSQLDEDLELQSNHLDIGSGSRVAHDTSVVLSAPCQNNVATSQMVVSTVELPQLAVLQQGASIGHLCRSSNPLSQLIHQVTSWNSPPLFAAPLQNELEKICEEVEQLQKSHEDMVSQLKSDCEKEMQEVIAQVRKKYELKLEDAEAEFNVKKNSLDKNQNKVLMNKLLAEAFSSRCLDLLSSGLLGMQQGIPPSSSMQHHHQPSLQHLVRPPPGVTACQPPTSLGIASPNVQAIGQLSRHSTRLSPITCQNFAAPLVQAAPHAVALPFSTTSRPPIINAIIPTCNLRFHGEIRSPAPHLQPLRPGAASSMPSASFPSISQHLQQMLPSQPLQSPPPAVPPPAAPQRPSMSQNRPQHLGGPPTLWNPSLSALELLKNVDHQPRIPGNHISSHLSEISSTFGSLQQS